MTETFATLRGKVNALSRLVAIASAGYHDDIYLNVQADRVDALMQTGGRQVMSYTTFSPSYFAALEGDGEAFVPVEKYLDYLDVAASEGTVEMDFDGTETDTDHGRLADRWEAAGAMNVRIRLPGSQDDLSTVPWALPKRFNDQHQFVSQACFDDDWELLEEFADPSDQKVPPTAIETTAEAITENIVSKADFLGDGEADYYPVVVDDGDLSFDMGRDNGNDAVWGDIDGATVNGPDVDNVYKKGFKPLFDTLEGDVTLATAPTPVDVADAPLVVTQATDDYVTRHVISSYSRQ